MAGAPINAIVTRDIAPVLAAVLYQEGDAHDSEMVAKLQQNAARNPDHVGLIAIREVAQSYGLEKSFAEIQAYSAGLARDFGSMLSQDPLIELRDQMEPAVYDRLAAYTFEMALASVIQYLVLSLDEGGSTVVIQVRGASGAHSNKPSPN